MRGNRRRVVWCLIGILCLPQDAAANPLLWWLARARLAQAAARARIAATGTRAATGAEAVTATTTARGVTTRAGATLGATGTGSLTADMAVTATLARVTPQVLRPAATRLAAWEAVPMTPARGVFNRQSGLWAVEELAQTRLRSAPLAGAIPAASTRTSASAVTAYAGRRDLLRRLAGALPPGKVAEEIAFATYVAEQRMAQAVTLQAQSRVRRLFLLRQRVALQRRLRAAWDARRALAARLPGVQAAGTFATRAAARLRPVLDARHGGWLPLSRGVMHRQAMTGQLWSTQGRREINGSQVKRLVKQIRAEGWGDREPIDVVIVNGRRLITDGHHRWLAARKLKLSHVPIRERAATAEDNPEQLWRDHLEAMANR